MFDITLERTAMMIEKKELTTTKRISSLEAIRAIAFLGVFLYHTDLNIFRSTGSWAVSVFLVISGFTMFISYYKQDRISNIGVIDNFRFACSKIRKLYFLHAVMTLCMVIFLIGEQPIKRILLKLGLNLLLVQEWVPLYDRSINGVSWYLCVMLLFYFVFPWVLNYMERKYTLRKACLFLSLLFVCQIVFGLIGKVLPAKEFNSYSVWEYFYTQWFVYYFPPTRLIDILIGCNLGYIFRAREHVLKPCIYGLLEAIAVLLSIVSNIIYALNRPLMMLEESNRSADSGRWWTWGVLFIIPSCMMVYLFSVGKGFLSRLFTGKVTLFLAMISSYAFLIHYVVFRYLIVIYYHIPNVDGRKFTMTYGAFISMTLGLLITVIASLLWMKIEKTIKERR